MLVKTVPGFECFATNVADMCDTLNMCFNMAHHVSPHLDYFLAHITNIFCLPKITVLGHHLLHQDIQL